MSILKHVCRIAIVALVMQSCDNDISSIGIYPESDKITNSDTIYEISSRSVLLDSVTATNTISYLGCVTDPETKTDISADFAAQFYTFENYTLPERNMMVGTVNEKETQGVVQCDNLEVRLYFNDYYGDANQLMKLEVYELSQDKILSEDSTYYTDIDFSKYIKHTDGKATPIASKIFSPKDYAIASTSDQSYISIKLDPAIGTKMMEKYYEDPNNYKNSYNFIHNVFPGLYFKISNGRGVMLSIYVGTLNLYFRYKETENGSTCDGMARFSATPEVIQSTRFQNSNLESLVAEKDYTYLKTPAGIVTELELPIDQMFSGKYANDSINKASVTLTRYNKEQNGYQLGTPATLLMVRKSDYTRFFKEKQVSNNRTSYTTSFNAAYNNYTFDNIGRLLSFCKNERAHLAQQQGITEEQWAQKNPDWNKVLLVPVTVTSSEINTNGYAQTVQVSVNHDMSMNSTRLMGGENNKLQMQVIYSKFSK